MAAINVVTGGCLFYDYMTDCKLHYIWLTMKKKGHSEGIVNVLDKA